MGVGVVTRLLQLQEMHASAVAAANCILACTPITSPSLFLTCTRQSIAPVMMRVLLVEGITLTPNRLAPCSVSTLIGKRSVSG